MKGQKTGGRQKGTANKKTREIADKAAEEGVTPLEIMLREMRYLDGRVSELRNAKEPSDPALLLGSIKELHEIAKDAAPYMHPKLQTSTIQGAGKDGEIVFKWSDA